MTIPSSITTSASDQGGGRLVRLTVLLFLVAPLTGGAYETDQYNNRLEPITDARKPLNGKVNETLQGIVDGWTGPRDDRRFVDKVYFRIGGVHWVDKLERWAMKSEDVERLSTPRRDSIYAGHPVYATRVAAMFGVGPTIKSTGC